MTNKLKAQQLMTLEELVSLIAPKVHEPGCTPSSTADKVRKRLRYAIDNGKLSSPTDDGRYELGVVITLAKTTWAKTSCEGAIRKWAEKFNGLPQTIVDIVEERLTATGESVGNTSDRDAMNQQLAAAQRVSELERENAQLAAKVARRENTIAKQRKAAQKPRKRIH